MSLYRYFSAVDKTSELPVPTGPLSKVVPSSSIEATNSKVFAALKLDQEKKTRGPYGRVSAEKKAEIGRRAAEHSVASTVHYYARKFPDPLKESNIHTWRNTYIIELEKKKRESKDDLTINKLPEKKRGHHYLLGEKLEMQVRAYLQTLRGNSAVVNTSS